MNFLKSKISKGSKEAVKACDLVTQRLRCINRQLLENPPSETLTDGFRRRAREAYNEHLTRCEGITLPLNEYPPNCRV